MHPQSVSEITCMHPQSESEITCMHSYSSLSSRACSLSCLSICIRLFLENISVCNGMYVYHPMTKIMRVRVRSNSSLTQFCIGYTYVNVCIRTYIHACIFIYIYIYIYIYIRTTGPGAHMQQQHCTDIHIHIYIHTYIPQDQAFTCSSSTVPKRQSPFVPSTGTTTTQGTPL